MTELPPSPSNEDGLSRTLIGVCVLLMLVFSLAPLLGHGLDVQAARRLLALAPPGSAQFRFWQPITYAFVHGSWVHLGLNMLGLWLFAPALEAVRGKLWLAETYFISVLWAGIIHVVITPWVSGISVVVGASGGLYGLMVAYALHFPDDRIPLLPGVNVRARWLALGYGLVEVYLLLPHLLPGAAWLDAKLGHVAHLAHLGGMLGGLMLGQRPKGWTPPPLDDAPSR